MATRKKGRKANGSAGGKNLEKYADDSNRYEEANMAVRQNVDVPQYPGAYKVNTKVLALMRDGKTWQLAEIYKVKQAKHWDTPIRSADCDLEENEDFTKTYLDVFIERLKEQGLINDEEAIKIRLKDETKNPEEGDEPMESSEDSRERFISDLRKMLRYEYYVDYLGNDRRLYRWVSEHMIKIDPSEIIRQQEVVSAK